VHCYTDEIGLSGHGTVLRVVGITKSATKRKCTVTSEVIGDNAQRLGFRAADYIEMTAANWICGWQRTSSTKGCSIIRCF
jgi:hypothetical protein